MNDSIISGCIAAFASVLVAFIARLPPSSAGTPPGQVVVRQPMATLPWVIAAAMIVAFAGLAPALIHHDLAGMAVFIIPPLTLILALAAPINLFSAVSITLGLHAANILLGPLSNKMAGSAYDTGVFVNGTIVSIMVINAVLVGFLSWIRRPRKLIQQPHALPPAPSRLEELQRLSQLRADGTLTEAEFIAEKQRILK